MRASSRRRRIVVIGSILLALIAAPVGIWLSLTHQPNFYRMLVRVPRGQLEAKAKHFVASSLRLRNDIRNERSWEAVFTDQEVNAWLAEDLVTHFADQIPPEVREPRVAFEPDRVTLAFQLDQGPIRSVIWVVAQVRVPEDNVLALTLEKIRAGVVPISAERIIEPLTAQAVEHGLDIRWTREDDMPVALIRYNPAHGRSDVVLERLTIRRGAIRLSGRSDRLLGSAVTPSLPDRNLLQLNFPRRNHQGRSPASRALRSTSGPTS
jgi:hypothetical protein